MQWNATSPNTAAAGHIFQRATYTAAFWEGGNEYTHARYLSIVGIRVSSASSWSMTLWSDLYDGWDDCWLLALVLLLCSFVFSCWVWLLLECGWSWLMLLWKLFGFAWSSLLALFSTPLPLRTGSVKPSLDSESIDSEEDAVCEVPVSSVDVDDDAVQRSMTHSKIATRRAPSSSDRIPSKPLHLSSLLQTALDDISRIDFLSAFLEIAPTDIPLANATLLIVIDSAVMLHRVINRKIPNAMYRMLHPTTPKPLASEYRMFPPSLRKCVYIVCMISTMMESPANDRTDIVWQVQRQCLCTWSRYLEPLEEHGGGVLSVDSSDDDFVAISFPLLSANCLPLLASNQLAANATTATFKIAIKKAPAMDARANE